MNPHEAFRPSAPVPPSPTIDTTRGLLVAAAAMTATLGLWCVNWLLTVMLGGAGTFLTLLLAVGSGAYLWFRKRDPQRSQHIEARVQQFARTTAAQMSARNPVASRPPGQRVHQTVPHAASATRDLSGLWNTMLLLPSLLAYGLVYGSVGFDSAWQPWWIINGLNVFFLICVAARAHTPGSRNAAMLPGIAGTVLAGLGTSPSPDVNLISIFSTKQTYEGYTYMQPPEDLLPWLHRAPALAVLLFVIAWGVARRDNSWAFGLIPAAGLLWWSIWYREHEFTGAAGWFGFWGLTVGVFLGGCLACWAADALTKRPAPQTHSFQPL